MNDLVSQDMSLDALNSLIMGGDMSKLSQKQKLDYYHAICAKAGLNPLTKPFDYMVLNGKQVLYANKGAAEQLRNIHGISVTSQDIKELADLIVVTVEGRNKEGRIDTEVGFARIGEGPGKLKGDALGNAMLKAVTKAKRRLTLSMAGLGMLDETEVESIPNAKKINVEVLDPDTGEIIPPKIEKPKEIFVQDPFKIQVSTKYFKSKDANLPDWASWAKTYWGVLSTSQDDLIKEWIDLNQDAFENCKLERPDIAEKINDMINMRVSMILDAKTA